MSDVTDEDWEDWDDDFRDVHLPPEKGDISLVAKRLSMTLPAEIAQAARQELLSADKKKFAARMLANDRATLLDHQLKLTDFVRDNANNAFTLAYEATMGAGKTMSILALADARFVWAEWPVDKLLLRYQAHVIQNLTPPDFDERSLAALDYHHVILASPRAARAILKERKDAPWLIFFDEFLSEAGHSSDFNVSMEFLKDALQRPMPQMILSSATRLSDPVLDLFRGIPGMQVERVTSSRHLVAWRTLAGVDGEAYPHQACKDAPDARALQAMIDKPTLARFVTDASCASLAQNLEVPQMPGIRAVAVPTIVRYSRALGALGELRSDQVSELCSGTMPATKASFSKRDLWKIARGLGQTTALLATNHVTTAAYAYFSQDIKDIRDALNLEDDAASAIQALRSKTETERAKLFKGTFLRKLPFDCVLDMFTARNREMDDVLLLLVAGIGLYSEGVNKANEAYATFVAERAQCGHFNLLIADATIAHGVNFAISKVLITPSIMKDETPATVFQLLGRAGRRGLSSRADVHGNAAFFEMLHKALLGRMDIFHAENALFREVWAAAGLPRLVATASQTTSFTEAVGSDWPKELEPSNDSCEVCDIRRTSTESTVDPHELHAEPLRADAADVPAQPQTWEIPGAPSASRGKESVETSRDSWFSWAQRAWASCCCVSRPERIR